MSHFISIIHHKLCQGAIDGTKKRPQKSHKSSSPPIPQTNELLFCKLLLRSLPKWPGLSLTQLWRPGGRERAIQGIRRHAFRQVRRIRLQWDGSQRWTLHQHRPLRGGCGEGSWSRRRLSLQQHQHHQHYHRGQVCQQPGFHPLSCARSSALRGCSHLSWQPGGLEKLPS